MRTHRSGSPRTWIPADLEASPKALRPAGALGTRFTIDAESPAHRSPLGRALVRFKQFVVQVAGVLLPGAALEALGLKGQRETTAAFVDAAELGDLFRVHRCRAEAAEREAVLATSADEKRALEQIALRHWLEAARHESPKQWTAHRSAHLSAERLVSFASTSSERAMFGGLQALLDGRLDEARSCFDEAKLTAMVREVDEVSGTEAMAELVRKLSEHSSYEDQSRLLTSVIEDARALRARLPRSRFGLVSLEVEAEHLRDGRTSPIPKLEDEDDRALLEIRFAPGPEAALAYARRTARTAGTGEHRFLACVAEAELCRRLGDTEGAIDAARRARAYPGSAERRGLVALFLASLIAARGGDDSDSNADRLLQNALAELDFQGGGFWERVSTKVSRIAELTVRLIGGHDLSFDPNPVRAPTADMQRVIDELVLARASLSILRGQPRLAGSLLERVKAKDFRVEGEKERLRRGLASGFLEETSIARLQPEDLARAIALTPLAKAATIPLALVLDGERFGGAVGQCCALDPMGMQVSLTRAGLTDLPPVPQSMLSAALRRDGSSLGLVLDGLVQSKQHARTIAGRDVERERAAFRRARARDLALSAIGQLDAGASTPAIRDFRRVDDALRSATETVALGLSRPGEARELELTAVLFGDRGARFSTSARPLPRAMLEAASELGRAARLVPPPSSAAPASARDDELFALALTAVPSSVGSLAEASSKLSELGRLKARVRLEPIEVGPIGGYSLEVGPRNRIVRIGGLTFEGDHWRLFEHGRERELARYRTARRRTRDPERLSSIRDLGGLRRFVSLRGRPAHSLREQRSRLTELLALEAQAKSLLTEMKEEGALPRAFYLMVDGIDAASKTSNGLRIAELIAEAGFESSTCSFKSRTEEEQREPYLARYDRFRPEPGTVFLADRSPLGDFAYAPNLTPADTEQMAEAFLTWQRSMEDDGIGVFKLLFYPGDESDDEEPDLPPLWRPMFTFGKRQARAEAARDLLLERRARGETEDLEGLVEASELSPGLNDLRSFQDGLLVHQRFQTAADLTAGDSTNPWSTIDTADRHQGRIAALEAFIAFLERRRPRVTIR